MCTLMILVCLTTACVEGTAGDQPFYRMEHRVNEDSGSGSLSVVTQGSDDEIAWQSIEQVIAWPVIDE